MKAECREKFGGKYQAALMFVLIYNLDVCKEPNVIIYYWINTDCSHKGLYFNMHTYKKQVKLELSLKAIHFQFNILK